AADTLSVGWTQQAEGCPAQAESRLFQLIFEHSPTAQAVITPGAAPRVIPNSAMAAMFGLSVDQFAHVLPMSLIHEGDRHVVAEVLRQLASGDSTRVTLAVRLLHSDGSTFHGQIAATALHDDEGEFESLLITLEDVTAQVEAAAALAQSEARARAL